MRGTEQQGRRPGLPWRRRGEARRSVRGAAEISVLAVVASLVTGVFFGSGISSTAVDLADGLTWIGDGPSGEVIQVNPATGRPQLRLQVAAPGDELSIAQYDGRMFVTNRTTGELQSFDLTRVLRSAARRVTEGEVVDTLVRDGEVYLVDRSRSTIARLDPATLDELGTIWTSEAGLADAVLDGQGDVWALEDDGVLHRLDWSEDAAAFDDTEEAALDVSGPGSVLVGHDDGVTVFGPDQGLVVQVGTSPAIDADAPRLGGELRAPEKAPSDLVPVSAPATGTVVLTTPGGVLEVDVAAIGCDDPGTPEVYDGIVYVPCLGQSKVVRLGPDGRRAQPDIETPGSPDPELVLDDDHLIVNTPGAEKGAVVGTDGDVTDLVRLDPTVPVSVPSTTADPPPVKPAAVVQQILGRGEDPRTGNGRDQDRDQDRDEPRATPTQQPVVPSGIPTTRPTGLPTALPSGLPTGRPTGPPTGPQTGPPTAKPTGSPTGDPTTGPSLRPGPDASPTDASPTAPTAPTDPVTSAVPTPRPSAQPTTGPETMPVPTTGPSQPPTSVDPTISPQTTQPPAALTAPTAVTPTEVSATQVRVSWNHPGAEQYVVARAGGGDLATVPGGNRQAVVTVQAGQSTSFTVTAVSGGERATSAPSAPVTTSAAPGAPTAVSAGVSSADYKTYRVDVTWGAAEDNGSPITSYEVSVQTEQGVRNVTTAGGARTARVTFVCPEFSCTGDSTAQVVAVNAKGRGPAASSTGEGPTPPPRPMPTAGVQLVTGHTGANASLEGDGETTLQLAPPADWAGFDGRCEYIHDGNQGGAGDSNVVFPCDATSITIAIRNAPYQREPSNGESYHSVLISAIRGTETVRAADYSWTTRQPTLCQNCQIP